MCVQSIVYYAIMQSLLICLVSCRECSHVHVFYCFEHLSHGVYPHSINVGIIITAASKKPPSVARKLLVARLGGITSLNNSELSFAIFNYKILNHIVYVK